MRVLTGNSVERYTKSIARRYLHAVIIMTVLIGATFATIKIALDRHALQQSVSFVTSSQFTRFQQLANQTRALMRASVDQNLPNIIVAPMINDIKNGIREVRGMRSKLQFLRKRLDRNLLERIGPADQSELAHSRDFDKRLEDFLQRAERIVNVSNEERRRRYSFWGPVDFAASSDGVLIRQFSDLIAAAHARTDNSIGNVTLITTALLLLLEAILVLASLLLFYPLLRKLHVESRLSKVYQGKLSKMAHIDPLTGLSNRNAYNLALQSFFEDFRNEGRGFSALLIDLNHFKAINDSFGHPTGDAVLRHVGGVLKGAVRSKDVAARLGGDEFAVLIADRTDLDVVESIARRIHDAIASEFEFEGRLIQVSASVGGAIVPNHARDEQELMRVADTALYSAKIQEGNVIIFDEESLAQRLEQNQMTSALAHAAERNEFVVHYQPKVDLRTRRHLGFEALVRWQHPEHGLLSPDRFLPLMEGSHLIRDMTRAVAETVARDIGSWKSAGLVPGHVAINFPEALLIGDQGYQMISTVIAETGIEWTDLSVEITEDVFLNRHTAHIHDVIGRFREKGVKISLDDFGTGFASLIHLRDFPFDDLKIDRSFVSGIGWDKRCEQIIRAVTDLARNLGKSCIAEGIETEDQLNFLLNAGCEIGQGYLFAKPQPALIAATYMARSAYAPDGWSTQAAARNTLRAHA